MKVFEVIMLHFQDKKVRWRRAPYAKFHGVDAIMADSFRWLLAGNG